MRGMKKEKNTMMIRKDNQNKEKSLNNRCCSQRREHRCRAANIHFLPAFVFWNGSLLDYSHAHLPSKLLRQMEKAWRADIGYW